MRSKGAFGFRFIQRRHVALGSNTSSVPVAPPRRLLLLNTDVQDPFLNIAAETYLYESADPETEVLFLWRNSKSVIIGRNQNPYKECKLSEMEKRGVLLVRRHTGGGAVYHDPGNSNFSFVSPQFRYNKDRNCAALLAALADVGVVAELKGRNDIVSEGQKISGHAYRYNGRNALHHGTLLRQVDMQTLEAVLNPSKEKLQSKGVESVRARVKNLSQVKHEQFGDALSHRWREQWPDAPVESRDVMEDDMLQWPGVKEQRESLAAWDWRFGLSPQFSLNVTKKFPWGLFDVHCDWDAGRVVRSVIYSDCLWPELVTALQAGLDAQLDPQVSKSIISGHDAEIDEFFAWIKHELH